jgi:hypothetical protein
VAPDDARAEDVLEPDQRRDRDDELLAVDARPVVDGEQQSRPAARVA